MNLTPENNLERILNGEDVTPSCRAEYFVKKAIDNAGGGGGGSVTVDSELSETSENPVQNKAIYARIAELEAAIEAANNDFKVEISTDGQTITVADGVTVANIVAAAEADKHVYAKVTVNFGGIIVYQRFELSTWAAGLNNYLVTFGAVQEDDDAAKPACIKGENTGGADTWTVA